MKPLVSSKLGHDTGILFARNLSTRRPTPVLIEPEGASRRRQVPGMLFYGPPGGGKSQGAKRVTLGLLARGNQCSILDPGSNPEWVRALAHLGDRVAVLDPTRGQVSVDGLRIFRREVAVERTLDHLLPMMGVEPDAEIARLRSELTRPSSCWRRSSLLPMICSFRKSRTPASSAGFQSPSMDSTGGRIHRGCPRNRARMRW